VSRSQIPIADMPHYLWRWWTRVYMYFNNRFL